ncbi:hypothetical protein [Streptococcus pneumoniae]|uniref:hypothetical protein n=2 Tax=Streptococcus pneumoniae TaxID=1313 RepID=UPI0005DC3AE9|nr:hypothetical protein [Streptococcus pneumoniae]CJA65521.1 serine/threonine protein kinase [Streptococcus pneumoniae]CJM83066.1 serine/threonine protein kinase [Streptococcus pneumoniae]CKH51196.1 serine/threonine protein kinase [Streptococcus pneumoniae]
MDYILQFIIDMVLFLKKQAYDEKRKNYVEDKRQNFPSLPSWKMDLFSEEEKRIYFQTTCEVSSKDSAINKYKMEKLLRDQIKGMFIGRLENRMGKK